MSQHDYVIDNGPGLAVRTDINAAIQALASINSGAVEPTSPVAGMLWLDTSVAPNGALKQRNLANSGWVGVVFGGTATSVTGSLSALGGLTVGPTDGATATAATGFIVSAAGQIYSKRSGTGAQSHFMTMNNAGLSPVLVGTFGSSGTIAIVSNEAGGGIQLRPNGIGSTVGMAGLDLAGIFTTDRVVAAARLLAETWSSTGASRGFQYDSGVMRTSNTPTTSTPQYAFYNPNGLVGTINTNGSLTEFKTTSDERLKTFTGDLSGEDAIAVIRADPARRFTWNSDGSESVGWGAQTSNAIHPYLASPPVFPEGDETVNPNAQPGEAGFVPWGMDYSRRTPFLWAALAKALDRIDDLEARLAALEASP